MADATNPQSGGTIDLRNMAGGGTSGAAADPNASGAGAGTPVAGAAGTADPNAQEQKFEIPETVRQQYPELVPLILATESMNDEERQYWFQILPIMTEEQVTKLREILVNEKQQLEKLDKEYDEELKRINTKHVSQWKEFEVKEKREKLKAAESQAKQSEKQTEEDLLKKLQEL